MASCGAAQFGPETPSKHRDLGGIFKLYVPILRSMVRNRRLQTFVYVDLHAGPGLYDYGAIGSPLLAVHAFHDEPYCAALHCFEQDADTYDRLTENSCSYAKLIAHQESNENAPKLKIPSHSHGLVFSDPNPNRENIPVEILKTFANQWPRIDLLCYVSAATIKRIRTAHNGEGLLESLAGINKSEMIVRKPEGKHQWTFILLTNWVGFPEWRKAGWVRARSEAGLRILEELDQTRRERRETHNPRLFDL